MLSSRCIHSFSKLSSSARLACRVSRLQRASCEGVILPIGISRRLQTTLGQSLASQCTYGRRFTRSLSITTASCDNMRIPQILANSIVEGAGVDSDVCDDDDEMSSPVKKGKYRWNPGSKH